MCLVAPLAPGRPATQRGEDRDGGHSTSDAEQRSLSNAVEYNQDGQRRHGCNGRKTNEEPIPVRPQRCWLTVDLLGALPQLRGEQQAHSGKRSRDRKTRGLVAPGELQLACESD